MAGKSKTLWFCKNCGAESAKWMGRCSSCGEWNSLIEEPVYKETHKNRFSSSAISPVRPQTLASVTTPKQDRTDTLNGELNRVLGGGIMQGSIVLLGGEPGIGKSTLALQTAMNLREIKTLYVSGEESLFQIKNRAERVARPNENCWFYTETLLEDVIHQCQELKPDLLFIDSIQTLYSGQLEAPPGSISQIRECASQLLRYAKTTQTSVILIGHITKDGVLAGPKVLEHIVDVVLQFEGDHYHVYRVIRPLKNRFGPTSELGIFEMRGEGLREVTNPSELLINTHEDALSGIAIGATIDGIRPFLIECQSLVSTAAYGTPQRSCTGFDARRLNMLLAVLEKRASFKLASKDVFLNMAGGLKVEDPGIDLAVIAAIMSSNADLAIPRAYCFAGEIGLSGEARPVQRVDQRIAEAQKAGFKKIFIAGNNLKGLDVSRFQIQIEGITKVEQLVRKLFG
jgi:DNA repair protein RadA/Sms